MDNSIGDKFQKVVAEMVATLGSKKTIKILRSQAGIMSASVVEVPKTEKK